MTSKTTTERQAGDDTTGFGIFIHDLVPVEIPTFNPQPDPPGFNPQPDPPGKSLRNDPR